MCGLWFKGQQNEKDHLIQIGIGGKTVHRDQRDHIPRGVGEGGPVHHIALAVDENGIAVLTGGQLLLCHRDIAPKSRGDHSALFVDHKGAAFVQHQRAAELFLEKGPGEIQLVDDRRAGHIVQVNALDHVGDGRSAVADAFGGIKNVVLLGGDPYRASPGHKKVLHPVDLFDPFHRKDVAGIEDIEVGGIGIDPQLLDVLGVFDKGDGVVQILFKGQLLGEGGIPVAVAQKVVDARVAQQKVGVFFQLGKVAVHDRIALVQIGPYRGCGGLGSGVHRFVDEQKGAEHQRQESRQQKQGHQLGEKVGKAHPVVQKPGKAPEQPDHKVFSRNWEGDTPVNFLNW